MAEEISSREELHSLQRDDLTGVGRLLLVLACAGAPPSLDYMAASFSQGLTRTLSALLASSQGSAFASWQQVRPCFYCSYAPWTMSHPITVILAYCRGYKELRYACSL